MSYYRDRDYYLICDRTGQKIRRSQSVIQWDGLVMRWGHEDPPPPTRLLLRPERPPRLVRRPQPPNFIGDMQTGFQSGGYQQGAFQ